MSESSEKTRQQLSTNRALTRELDQTGFDLPGVLEEVGLTVADLRDRKILDVGVGGGLAFAQARKLGLDYYSVDILPVHKTENIPEGERTKPDIVLENIRIELIANAGRLVASDFTVGLPFSSSSFDVVLSSCAAPMYARNPQEAKRSIIEMLRVSRGMVAFSSDMDEAGFDTLGAPSGPASFRFPLKEFLEELKGCGISFEIITKQINVFWGNTQSTHIDTSKKNNALFYEKARELLNDPDYPVIK